MTPVAYHEAAEEELLREIEYLERRSLGLGRRFFTEVQKAEVRMAQFPESAPEILPGIRKCLLLKFPYSLIDTAEKDGLLILPVAHHSRRPSYWVDRVQERERGA